MTAWAPDDGPMPDEPSFEAQPPDPDDEFEAQLRFNQQVNDEARRIEVREAARDRVKAKKGKAIDLPPLVRLDTFLARPLDPITHRIAGLWPVGGRVLLAAQFKAGKTTLRDNVVRSLVDGLPFLGQFEVAPFDGSVVLIDFELDEHTLQRWLEDQGLTHATRVGVVSMKGYGSTFNILEPSLRSRWATALRAAQAAVLVIDCLRPIIDALGLSEDKDSGRVLLAIDELAREAGVREVLVVHHMGHSGERSRGDSRLRDWPDAEWKLVRDKDSNDPASEDPRGLRYFSAFGRDVDHPETGLGFDPTTRHLTIGDGAGSRKQVAEHRKVEQAIDLVLTALTESPGLGKRALREYIRNGGGDVRNESIDAAARQLAAEGRIRVEIHGKSHLHFVADEPLVPVVPAVPDRAPGTASVTVPRAYRGTGTPHHTEGTPEEEAGHGHGPTEDDKTNPSGDAT